MMASIHYINPYSGMRCTVCWPDPKINSCGIESTNDNNMTDKKMMSYTFFVNIDQKCICPTIWNQAKEMHSGALLCQWQPDKQKL